MVHRRARKDYFGAQRLHVRAVCTSNTLKNDASFDTKWCWCSVGMFSADLFACAPIVFKGGLRFKTEVSLLCNTVRSVMMKHVEALTKTTVHCMTKTVLHKLGEPRAAACQSCS